MVDQFFEKPILNSPYDYPAKHWELDAAGQPTQKIIASRTELWNTEGPPPKCHVNWVVLDSDWEAEFCRVAESHPQVRDVYQMDADFKAKVQAQFGEMIASLALLSEAHPEAMEQA